MSGIDTKRAHQVSWELKMREHAHAAYESLVENEHCRRPLYIASYAVGVFGGILVILGDITDTAQSFTCGRGECHGA